MTVTPPWAAEGRHRPSWKKPQPWLGAGVLALVLAWPMAALAQNSGLPAGNPKTMYLRPETSCPVNLPVLVRALLRDLPTYANLVASRSLGPPGSEAAFGAVLLAGEPEFDPINLEQRSPRPVPHLDETVQQVFFTTLERQYLNQQLVTLQNYHWLFLAPDDDDWRMVLLYSSLGSYPDDASPPTPPQESSTGIIGQAVRLWLRDCRAGAVSPPTAADGDTGS